MVKRGLNIPQPEHRHPVPDRPPQLEGKGQRTSASGGQIKKSPLRSSELLGGSPQEEATLSVCAKASRLPNYWQQEFNPDRKAVVAGISL